MKEISVKKYVRYLFGIAILVFILNKLFLRPWLSANNVPDIFLIVTYSIPNLIEATIGTLVSTGILLQMRQYFNEKFGSVKDTYIHIMAVCIVTIYVISQELKFHNLGGNNVYDPYDVIASLIGLVTTFGIIQLFGFIEKNDACEKSIEE